MTTTVSAAALPAAPYARLRGRILDLARSAGAEVYSHVHPWLRGIDGEELAVDCAWLGPRDAASVVVVLSGVHGAELLAGSLIQRDALETMRASDLPDGVALLLVHAANPWGASFMRRQDHEGVDINRNFIDHEAARDRRESEGAAHFARDITWFHASLMRQRTAEDQLRWIRQWHDEHGDSDLRVVLGPGQHDFPGSVYYGGRKPSWSNAVVRQVLRSLRHARVVVVIDIHTGLGERGVGTLLSPAPEDSAELAQAREAFREVQSLGGDSLAYAACGTVMDASREELASEGCDVLAVGLEFGTLAREKCLAAHLASNQAWLEGIDARSDRGRQVRAAMLAAYAPEDADWRAAVLARARAVLDQAIAATSREMR